MTPAAESSAVRQRLAGWGNLPVEWCLASQPETLAALQQTIVSGASATYIARGMGRAYGDSSLNREAGVVVQTRLNRLLHFDETTGVLEAEAGVSFAEVIEHLLPRGWFWPVTPGTKFVTLGGAIAADVHGKNHHRDGSLGNYILDLQLLTAAGDIVRCSPTEHPEWFWATIGGMGLTGCIVSARVQLKRVPSAFVRVTYRRTANLDETLECFTETDAAHRYSVAWIDCLATGNSLGRSVVMLGDPAPADELPAKWRDEPWRLPRKRTKSVPCNFPSFALNSWSVKLFNALYYARHGDGVAIVDYDSYFYPLDGVLHWNRIYGRRGFVQYQALFPRHSSLAGLRELLEKVAALKMASFLAVLKSSGPASQGLLSFPFEGHTLALDLPNNRHLGRVAGELDRVLLKHGGRLYLAKDALTTAEAFREMYPSLPQFLRVKAELDPGQRFSSSQARRLGILNDA